MRYALVPYTIVSSRKALGPHTRKGRVKSAVMPTSQAPARLRAAPPPACHAATPRNGIATKAYCFCTSASATSAPAQPQRPRKDSANASTSANTTGASRMPNQVLRIIRGLAANNAPAASRSSSAPGRSSAAGSSASANRSISTRTSPSGPGSAALTAPSTGRPGKYARCSSATVSTRPSMTGVPSSE